MRTVLAFAILAASCSAPVDAHTPAVVADSGRVDAPERPVAPDAAPAPVDAPQGDGAGADAEPPGDATSEIRDASQGAELPGEGDSPEAGADAPPDGTAPDVGCTAGRADCDGDPRNGCETELRDDTDNCGACGVSCLRPSAVMVCTGMVCFRSRCEAGFADCDTDIANGCEVALVTDANCGACGRGCAMDRRCDAGRCVPR